MRQYIVSADSVWMRCLHGHFPCRVIVTRLPVNRILDHKRRQQSGRSEAVVLEGDVATLAQKLAQYNFGIFHLGSYFTSAGIVGQTLLAIDDCQGFARSAPLPCMRPVTAAKVVNTTMAAAKLGKLATSRSALFVCDIQEKFRNVIAGFPAVVDTAQRMVKGAKALEVPVVVTEQYPKGLGHTVPELAELLPEGTPVVDKTLFSMCVDPVQDHLRQFPAVNQVMLVGIEAHVCVLQTTLDLIEQGYEVHILVDGVSSSRLSDREVALQRLAQSGALLSTSEMALFQLAGHAKHPAFKTISAIAKEPRPPAPGSGTPSAL